MPRPVPNLTDRRFGRLVAKEQAGWITWTDARVRAWRCECDCGRTKRVAAKNLLYGRTMSCGCLKRDQNVALGCPVLGADGTLYPSQAEAARRLGIDVHTVTRRLEAGKPVDHILRGSSRPVVDPHGTWHPSMTAAAEHLGLTRCFVRYHLDNPASGWRRA